MFEDSKLEYLVKSCAIDDTDALENLLNEMARAGWELYSLNESEGDDGLQYNCIFSRSASDSQEENNNIAEVGHFKSRMEKLLHSRNDLYEQAKSIQEQLRQKNERIIEIKQLLDSNSSNVDHEKLNREISEKLTESNTLKIKFSEILSPSNMYERINQDILTVVVSEELVDLIDNERNGELLIESVRIRQALTDKFGYIIPPIKFLSSDEMTENQYSINVRKLKALSGIAYQNHRMFKHGQSNLERKPRGAIDSIDPITGQKVFWIEKGKTKNYWDKGLNASQVIAEHLEFIACKYVEEILSYGEMLNYISLLGEENLFLAEELIQGAVSLGDLRYVFAKLIREKVSVRDIIFVFEKLNDLLKSDFDNDQLVHNLRILMAKQICSDIADSSNCIYGIIPTTEQNTKLQKSLDKKSKGKVFTQNHDVKEFIKFVCQKVNHSEYNVLNTAIIVKPQLRLPVFYLFEQIIPNLRVLSEDELTEEFKIELF